eukprot:1893587-Pleurochrysis_carterae.AAC.4
MSWRRTLPGSCDGIISASSMARVPSSRAPKCTTRARQFLPRRGSRGTEKGGNRRTSFDFGSRRAASRKSAYENDEKSIEARSQPSWLASLTVQIGDSRNNRTSLALKAYRALRAHAMEAQLWCHIRAVFAVRPTWTEY